MVQTWHPTMKCRRSTVSASAPAGSASRNVGTIVAACTRLTLSASGESEVISQPAPVFCIQVPSAVTTLAHQSMRKTRWRSGTRAAGLNMAAMLARPPGLGNPGPYASSRF